MTNQKTEQELREKIQLNKLDHFKEVHSLEQNKDGQWYVIFKNGAIGKIDFIERLSTLISQERAEAVRAFVDYVLTTKPEQDILNTHRFYNDPDEYLVEMLEQYLKLSQEKHD